MATAVLLANCANSTNKQLTDWVNPFLGTATLWEPEDLGYVRTAKELSLIHILDWIGLYDACYDEFKRTLAKAAGTIPERVAVHALHQHDAPRGNIHDEFVIETLQRLELAVATSLKHAEPVTHIGYGEAEVYKVASNRRILDPNTNKVRAQRWTCLLYTSCA